MDGILGIGPLEIIIIVALALIFLGPERLPGTIREIAKFIRQTRAIGNELTSQFSKELNMLDEFNPKKIMDDVIGDEKEINAKELLGIDEEELKEAVDDSKKKKAKTASSTASIKAKSTKSSTSNSSSTATPATGRTPTNTSKKHRPKPALGEVDTASTDDVDAVDTDEEEINQSKTKTPSNQQANRTPASKKTSSEHSQDGDQQGGLNQESVTENQIAPPNGASARSLVAEKAGSSTHSTDSPSDENLPEGVDPTTDAKEQ